MSVNHDQPRPSEGSHWQTRLTICALDYGLHGHQSHSISSRSGSQQSPCRRQVRPVLVILGWQHPQPWEHEDPFRRALHFRQVRQQHDGAAQFRMLAHHLHITQATPVHSLPCQILRIRFVHVRSAAHGSCPFRIECRRVYWYGRRQRFG